MIQILRAKLHGLQVTGADLDYHGSITLDPVTCRKAGIVPTEFVDIWNKNSGARISTYVIYGLPGSNCCILNGAAARTCQVGDEIIIAASEYVAPGMLPSRVQTVLTFTEANEIRSIIRYHTGLDSTGQYTFRIEEEAPDVSERAENLPQVPA
jgi:aspartate 1-decarboxylase